MKKDTIGGRVKFLRKDLGLSQNQLAERVRTSQSHISRVERSKLEPSLMVLRKLAQALVVDLEDLITEVRLARKPRVTRNKKKH